MDLRMPGGGGVHAITELTRLGNPARVLVLTTCAAGGTVPGGACPHRKN